MNLIFITISLLSVSIILVYIYTRYYCDKISQFEEVNIFDKYLYSNFLTSRDLSIECSVIIEEIINNYHYQNKIFIDGITYNEYQENLLCHQDIIANHIFLCNFLEENLSRSHYSQYLLINFMKDDIIKKQNELKQVHIHLKHIKYNLDSRKEELSL
ncbi:hypothetical protein [Empedobacter brevis]|uniref:hypothetical protein n=1 Tax=Empedobacter brevis TaxID=247 RepID=UPI0039B0C218